VSVPCRASSLHDYQSLKCSGGEGGGELSSNNPSLNGLVLGSWWPVVVLKVAR
jgi:hypothetical protein